MFYYTYILFFTKGRLKMHKLNVIISRTDTLVGKSVRALFGGRYNHCAISFDDNFDKAYSFSRRYKHLWFTGCFCMEDLNRYEDYIIYQVSLSDSEFDNIMQFIQVLNQKFRIYDYLGAVTILLGVKTTFRYHYICSTFASKILSMTDSIILEKSLYSYKPMELVELLDRHDLFFTRKGYSYDKERIS